MKTTLKNICIMLMAGGLLISCKNKDNSNMDNKAVTDSTDMSVDTIDPAIDSSATLNSGKNGKNGTTVATGESSTGSGTDGSTQKGNQNIKTDSI